MEELDADDFRRPGDPPATTLDLHELLAHREEEPAGLRVFWLQTTDEGRLERIEVTEAAGWVMIAIYLRSDMDLGGKLNRGLHACDVPLGSPLGERLVIDGGTAQPVKRTDEQTNRGWDDEYLKLETPAEIRRLP